METTTIFHHPTLDVLRLARFYIQRGESNQECIKLLDIEIKTIQDYFAKKNKLKKPSFNPELLNKE